MVVMKKCILVLAMGSAGFAQQPAIKPPAVKPAPVKPAAAKPAAAKPAAVKPAATPKPENAGGLFNQAPPESNRKLMAAVQQFFQLHVDGKFRQVTPLVAEDAQDDYFNSEKTKYRDFEILRVEYSDNFKKAKVTAALGVNFVFRGQTMPLKAPMTSNWKIEKGQWRWYVDKTAKLRTPFGAVEAGPGDPKDHLITRPQTVAQVLGQVKIEKKDIRLSSFEASSDSVIIDNQMPGVVTLSVECEALPGLTCKLAETELKADQKTKLLIKYEPADKSPKPMRRVDIVVAETGARLPLAITFAVSEELLKDIPKP